MCISWYDMTMSCSVPPTSTWCHSGGSYELTVPVYNFLLTGGQYLLYINTMHILTGLIFQPRPFILFLLSSIDTSPLYLYKVSESIYILHNILLWVSTMNIFILCEGYCSLYISASVFTPSINGLFLSGKYVCT